MSSRRRRGETPDVKRQMGFKCASCGEIHDGFGDLAFAAPYYYYTVPENEREQRCVLTSDLCAIDNEDLFIRGCLEIPIVGRPETFTWGRGAR